jgi:hypothetical protein
MRARNWTTLAAALVAVNATGLARAQGQPPPLPALPPPAAEPPAPPPPPPPSAATPPSDFDASLPPGPPPPPPPYSPPPPGLIVENYGTRRAPSNALWVGGRLGVLAYGGGLYINDQNTGAEETTGDFIRPGAAFELDAGARIARHYVPYVGLELGLAPPGRRFDGTDTSTGTTFAGIGFRYLAGDIDSVAFLSDLSFGFRWFHASNGSGSWSAMGLELFRLGLGAEIRVTSEFTLSPLVTISGGMLTDTSGNISFAPNQPDGQTGPAFTGSASIPSFAQSNYYAFVLGCGAHFDLFGK